MPKIEKDLEKETLRWLKKIEVERKKIRKVEDKEFLENIDAYIKDTSYFLEKKDLIRAFEAVIWAWAWLEIGKRKGLFS